MHTKDAIVTSVRRAKGIQCMKCDGNMTLLLVHYSCDLCKGTTVRPLAEKTVDPGYGFTPSDFANYTVESEPIVLSKAMLAAAEAKAEKTRKSRWYTIVTNAFAQQAADYDSYMATLRTVEKSGVVPRKVFVAGEE